MALFKRRQASQEAAGGDDQADEDGRTDEDGRADRGDDTASGPYDEAERPSLEGMADFGAIRLPLRSDVKVSAQVAKASGRPLSVSLSKDGSQLELQAYAAPKTLGIWEEGLDDLAKSVAQQGGRAERREGRFGPELVAEVPQKTAQGRTGKQVIRFIGVDGPRWLLRGAITGKAARDPAAGGPLEDLFAQVVVARGDTARPPREPLPLNLPGMAGAGETAESADPADPTALLRRGPEITEVR
jgi:hypothetical protein